jgi:hypothetical protein
MVEFYWHIVAEGFRERFPERELELLSAILSHPENLWSTRSSNGPGAVAEAIVRAHPDEAWAMVSKLLESDETHSFGIASWLGGGFGFAERLQAGVIKYFDPDMTIAWVLQNPEMRLRRLRDCLPKTLDEQAGGRLTKLFLEAFGDHKDVADFLVSHFFSVGGWAGPESAYRASQRDKARQWASENKSGKVLAWLYRYIEALNRDITQSELREERGF